MMYKYILTFTLAVVLAGCSQPLKPAGNVEPEPVTVRVMTVGRQAISSCCNYVGRVEPSRSTVVSSRLPGTVTELNARPGMRVSEGEVIARIESESVKSAYEIARVTLAQAEDGYERVRKVYASGSVPEVKYIEVKTQLEKARAAEKSAREALEDCVVKAPFSGVMGETFAHKGEKVLMESPLVSILDLAGVEVHFSVPESEYSSVKVGCEVEIEVPAIGRTLTGRVAVKGITASPLSHSYDFTAKNISNAVALMPGMVCKIRIRTSGDGEIVVPASAVKTDMTGRYVWSVNGDDRVCKTYVTVAGFSGKGVILSEGVSEGDRVIVEGSRKVSGGMKVKAEEK